MEFDVIKNPHLPTGKVCHVICGKLPSQIYNSLSYYVDEIITIRAMDKVEKALQTHVDLSVCPLPDNKIIISDSQLSLKEKLISLGFYVIIDNNVKSPYPNDCPLNYVDNEYYTIINNNIHYHAECCHNMPINVKQGYVKCSVAPVAKNAIITDDANIAKNAGAAGLDVCFVQKGDIFLQGYPYGFIGGACAKVSKNIMVFCGNLETHKDCRKIRDFLYRYEIKAVNLADSQLLDVGSIIPLTQMKGC